LILGCQLVKGFTDRWKPKEEDSSFSSKIKNVGKKQDPLKEQIVQVTQRLDIQTKTLDAAVQRFQMRETDVFNRVVKAMTDRDRARANILATELAEIRKVEKMLSQASLGLQSISMRLNTVSEMGDLVTILNPAKTALGGISSEMCSIFPQASEELGNIGSLLSDIVCTTSQSSDMQQINTTMTNADALSILEEAEAAAENHLKAQLPEAEMEKPMQRRSVETYS
jgi:division protein CdvB (Snf7/Vps24/ESCRT-III family)